jgi:Protein of unknown function (DUF4238)
VAALRGFMIMPTCGVRFLRQIRWQLIILWRARISSGGATETKKQPIKVYWKPSGATFQCWPENVCAESGGDLNPDYFKDPAVLGQFRAIFESRWDAAIDAVEKRKLTTDDKFVIAGYWANLLTTTPTWRKIGQKLFEQEIRSILPIIARNYVPTERLKGLRLSVEIDENYIKGIATKQLLAGALVLYHQPWTILTNDTSHEFLTSDNPSAIFPPLDPGGTVARILPLSPRLCISTTMERSPVYREVVTRADLAEPPKGWVTYHHIVPNGVKLANRLSVVNAERFVFSRVGSSGVAALVKKYGDHSVQLEHSVSPIPEGDGISTESRLFVGKKR